MNDDDDDDEDAVAVVDKLPDNDDNDPAASAVVVSYNDNSEPTVADVNVFDDDAVAVTLVVVFATRVDDGCNTGWLFVVVDVGRGVVGGGVVGGGVVVVVVVVGLGVVGFIVDVEATEDELADRDVEFDRGPGLSDDEVASGVDVTLRVSGVTDDACGDDGSATSRRIT